jgi:PadR family transcriptional regulator PadR
MLILKTLALEPMHGYGVALRIEQISNGVFRVNPGSLLPALSRMERAGRVKSEWRATENNRRAKYYLLTAKGRKALTAETEQWQRQILAISRILLKRDSKVQAGLPGGSIVNWITKLTVA